MDYKQLMRTARETNARRDSSELRNGFTPESKQPPHIRLRTAISAIEAGITSDNWSCIAEAQAILETIDKTISKALRDKGMQ